MYMFIKLALLFDSSDLILGFLFIKGETDLGLILVLDDLKLHELNK